MIDTNTTPTRTTTRLTAGRVARMILKPLASLQLTVVLFALSLVLVFFGTLAQKNAGVWTVVDKYFYSWFVWVDFQQFANFAQVFFNYQQGEAWKGAFPIPAGKLLGWAMFVNLMAAHLLRFKLTWKRSGIFILHGGVILLLVGEYVTREFQVEQRMVIHEGGSAGSAFDTRDYELAFVDSKSDPKNDRVTVVPAQLLIRAAKTGERIRAEDLPVEVGVTRWMANSKLVPLLGVAEDQRIPHKAVTVERRDATAVEVPEVSGVDPNQQIDLPSAFVTLYQKGSDTELGRYLVSLRLNDDETIQADGKDYTVGLRFKQHVKPFKLTLLKFTHERYLGTNLPKNFSSRVRIDDPEEGVSREVDISMNEPLRYRGEAFFQAGFDEENEEYTVLQVVRNPGWTLPYWSCLFVTLGMTVHFLIYLLQYLRRKSDQALYSIAPFVLLAVAGVVPLIIYLIVLSAKRGRMPSAPTAGVWKFAGLIGGGVAALYLASNLSPANRDGKLDLSKLAVTPVVDSGRLKPLDSVARIDLRRLNEREDVTVGEEKYSALKWYLEVATARRGDLGRVQDYKVFRIQNLEVLGLLKLKPRDGWRYALAEILPGRFALREAAVRARAVPDKDRTAFEVKVLETYGKLSTFLQIAAGGGAMTLPPGDGKEWRTLSDVTAAAEAEVLATMPDVPMRPSSFDELFTKLEETESRVPKKDLPEFQKSVADLRAKLEGRLAAVRDRDPAAATWAAVLAAYRSGNAAKFDEAVALHQEQAFAAVSRGDRLRAKLELFLNNFAPYYHATILYGFALAASLACWILMLAAPAAAQGLRRGTFWLVLVTFAVHTFTLLSRMYLMERPLVFITNLYSSAVFIGWAAAGVCLLIERIFPIGLGNLVAASIGLGTCIVGHNLAAAGGDTLEMMRAVLDTNFWLATHVTTVTFGYTATYIAGVIGMAYIALGLFTPRLGHMVQLTADPDKKPQPLGKLIGQAMYGVICMAMLFSFVGTVLGGIWADQSWGRFWGWDPKENGAVMIVIWNALILHARWCGLVKNRGTAILTLVGNMITTWSWFGTNQLGVGLHAYGFSNDLVITCVGVWISHLVFIAVALSVPPQYWRSDTSKA